MRPLRFMQILLALIFITFLDGCSLKKKEDIRLLSVKGPSVVVNYSDFYTDPIFEGAEGSYTTLPVHDNDILLLGADDETVMFMTNEDLPDTLRVRSLDSLIFINDKIAGLKIEPGSDMLPWFRQMLEVDKKALKTVMLNSNLPETYRPYLEQIAKSNPRVNFIFQMDSTHVSLEDLQWVASKFQPSLISVNLYSSQLEKLTMFSQLKTLMLGIMDTVQSGQMITLPVLPELKQLFLSAENTSLPADFFSQNPQLETLILYGHYSDSLGKLNPMKRLKAFTYQTADKDSTLILPFDRMFPNLEVLNFPFTDNANIENIIKLKKIKWLNIQGAPGHAALERVVKELKGLELLAISKADTGYNFAPVKNATRLKYFIISDSKWDYQKDSSLDGLTALKYLSLPEDYFEDTSRVVTLQKSLPNTVITPNTGLCMGSGWLLMLIPLTVVFYCLNSFKKEQAA